MAFDALFQVLSPSQIETFRDWSGAGSTVGCRRKWAFEKIDRVAREEDTEDQQFGTKLHEKMEAWLGEGRMPRGDREAPFFERLAHAGVLSGQLPEPGTDGLKIEGEIEVKFPLGHRHLVVDANGEVVFDDEVQAVVIGRVDYSIMTEEPLDYRLLDGRVIEDCVVVGDHKTTKDFNAYSKDAAELRGEGSEERPGDPQAAGYSLWACVELHRRHGRFPKAVVLRWTYYVKEDCRNPPIRTVEAVVDTTDLTIFNSWIESYKRDALAMRDLMHRAELVRLNEEVAEGTYLANRIVEPDEINLGACRAFRGCRHLAYCERSMGESPLIRLGTKRKKKKEAPMALKDVLNQAKKVAAAKKPIAKVTPPDEEPEEVVEEEEEVTPPKAAKVKPKAKPVPKEPEPEEEVEETTEEDAGSTALDAVALAYERAVAGGEMALVSKLAAILAE